MKLGIMQPYFFPYLGYFQLIKAVDRFVIYDDVNFIKGGWINRNFILSGQGPQRITLQLVGASPNKLINAVEVGDNIPKILMTISQMYGKAPCYRSAFPVIEKCLLYTEKNLARFLEFSIRDICQYLGIQAEIVVSSEIKKDNALKGSDKVIAICKQQGAEIYVNAIGGQKLYDKSHFNENGLQLCFLQMGNIVYQQYQREFVPNLSVIDVMMFSPPDKISRFLQECVFI